MEFTLEGIGQYINALPESYAVLIWDETGGLRTLTVSADLFSMLGTKEEAFWAGERRELFHWIAEQDRAAVIEKFQYGFQTEIPIECAYRILSENAEGIIAHTRASFPGTLAGRRICFASIISGEASTLSYKHISGTTAPDMAASDTIVLQKSISDKDILSFDDRKRLADQGEMPERKEQKRTEEELMEKERELKRALEEARTASHAKSDFLSSMSHDIRTPLNAIVNLTNLLLEELDDKEKLCQDIQKMEVAGEFLLQLINDVLDVSAIESGKLKLVPGVYTYSTFLNYIRGIIAPLCENKDIHFILDEGPTALDIYMDRVRFHQVFFNILSNAVKYTPPGGTVTFRTTNNVVHDGILSCDFVVTDTGCGMSREFIDRVFEPFVREDTKNAYVGTGLGLSICKRILDLMGGTISIESELGKGTKVTVHMDLQIATEEQREESRAELDTSYKRHVVLQKFDECRILVAEDNAINSEILMRLLVKKNYVVECVSDGKQAVRKIDEHDGGYYHIVLMDIRMPVMDGLMATKLIRQNPDEKKRNVPIIAITANAFEADTRECLEAGMNACLAKPVAPAALYEMVATYVQTEE